MMAAMAATPPATPPAIAAVLLLLLEAEDGTMIIVAWMVVVTIKPSASVDLKECIKRRQPRSIDAYWITVENTEVNVLEIGGAPELWEYVVVIVTIPGV
jgi:hypothetical protein